MNAYPNFTPPCLEKDTITRDRVQPKAQAQQPYPTQSSLTTRRKSVLQADSSLVIESVLSPAKYALFQVFGTIVFQHCRCTSLPPSYASSAKIGAFGGIIVTIFYLMLVLTRHARLPATTEKDDSYEEQDPNNLQRSLTLLFHETLYSALASAIGSMAYSRSGAYHVDIAIQTLAGCVGPILFLMTLFSFVGVVWCFLRAQKKALDWYAGY